MLKKIHVLMNKIENIPDNLNFFPFYFKCIFFNISLIVGQNLPDCKTQTLVALICLRTELVKSK